MRTLPLILVASAAALSAAPLAAQQAPPDMAEGAIVYANNCSRCHNPRAGTERTDAEWVTIVGHMRARANMTKREAQAVLLFLQTTNLPEGGAADVDLAAAARQMVAPASLLRALVEHDRRTHSKVGETPVPGGKEPPR